MANYISVSPEELQNFSQSVKNFKQNAETYLQQLESDTNALRSSVDEQTIVPVDNAVKRIKKIIDEAGPSLNTVASQAEAYAQAIARIMSKLQSR